MRFVNLTGRKFGRLTVKAMAERIPGKRIHWICDCECGRTTICTGENLQRPNKPRGCGCLRESQNGMWDTVEYNTWASMIRRCKAKGGTDYKRYGSRGITVCDRWKGKAGFSAFLSDMGMRPSDGHSLDRINNNGNYEPGNCRWATIHQQAENTRTAVIVEHDGKRMCLAAWARHSGIKNTTLRGRLSSGWSFADAVSTPPKPQPWITQ